MSTSFSLLLSLHGLLCAFPACSAPVSTNDLNYYWVDFSNLSERIRDDITANEVQTHHAGKAEDRSHSRGKREINGIYSIVYAGTAKYNDLCATNNEIAGDQSENPNVTLNMICNLKTGLECRAVWNEETSDPDDIEYRCRCMIAYGRRGLYHETLDKCFIPAGKGLYSKCFAQEIRFALPHGEQKDPNKWNRYPVKCVPQSICQEGPDYIGKRCVCAGDTILNHIDGTCNQGTHYVNTILLQILSYIAVTVIS